MISAAINTIITCNIDLTNQSLDSMLNRYFGQGTFSMNSFYRELLESFYKLGG
jgi:hypothetical protein